MKLAIASDDLCVKVYDPKKKKLIGVYDSYARAGAKLGLTGHAVQQRTSSKLQVYAPHLKMKVAIRLAALGEKEKELIEQTRKVKTL